MILIYNSSLCPYLSVIFVFMLFAIYQSTLAQKRYSLAKINVWKHKNLGRIPLPKQVGILLK
ncbi:hypothetical protein [Helicobacter pullorum]|uniref:hypothetical protein n=1 Tax=Helicobacter pullorum TaxID=35818 RepID=UPI000CF17610|nr:hypothetical protein [Helicobacter pullorum]